MRSMLRGPGRIEFVAWKLRSLYELFLKLEAWYRNASSWYAIHLTK